MADNRQVPSVPNVSDPVLRNFLSAVREAINNFSSTAGLTASNLLSTLVSVAGGGSTLSGILDATIPPIPTGFTANGDFTTVILTWDNPHYLNYNFAEIYRASALDIHGAVLPSSSVPLSTAIIAGTSNGFIFIDSVNPGEVYYYWVRFKSNADIYGPYNASLGVLGSTVGNINTLMTDNGWTVAAENVYQTGQWIGSAAILNGSITNTKIAASAVGTAQLVDSAISSAKIASGAVGTTQIANAAITYANMAAASVGAAQIQALAVTNAAIGALAVGEANIQALAVTNAKIGNLAVDTAQIKDLAISNAKMGLLSVATAQIQDLAVTSSKIASLAVEKLYSVAAWIQSADILDGAVTNAKIGQTIQAINYNPSAHTGWLIDKQGNITSYGSFILYDSAGNTIFASGSGFNWNNVTGSGIPSVGANASGNSGNLLTNAGMYLTADPWSIVPNSFPLYWNLVNWCIKDGGAPQGTIGDSAGLPSDPALFLVSYMIPCIPGQRVEFSAYTGAHRCTVSIYAECYDSSNTQLGSNNATAQNSAISAGGKYLSGYMRLGGFFIVPANAVKMRLVFHKDVTYTGQTSSYGFMCLPYVGIASPNQTVLSDWSDGSSGAIKQIDAGNASTYIANAAIQTAHIGDANITTLKIGANQVTVPSSATSSSIAIYCGAYSTSITTICTLSGTFSGQPVFINYSSAYTASSTTIILTHRIYRDAVLIYEGGTRMLFSVSGAVTDTGNCLDTPTADSHTYTIVAFLDMSITSYAGSGTITKASIVTLECKR